MNNFVKRTLSGIIFVALIVSSILLNKFFFASLFVLLSVLTVVEFHKITNLQKGVGVNLFTAAVGAILLYLSLFCFASGIDIPVCLYYVYPIYFLIAIIAELYRQKENPINNIAYLVMGQIYIVLPFSILNFILFLPDASNYQPFILLALFACIWVNDTGAYLVGVTFGKHRLFERISPKKSWEGFFGGACLVLLFAYALSLLFPVLSLWQWFVFAEIVVVFGTFGDLTESLLKRTLNVKDSSNILPGHGGLLDRFDSMLLAAPAILIFLKLIL